jgi:hypothetical protein
MDVPTPAKRQAVIHERLEAQLNVKLFDTKGIFNLDAISISGMPPVKACCGYLPASTLSV